MLIKLGAHQSIKGGYHKGLERIANIGGNCLQIFSSSPKDWHLPTIREEERNKFLNLKEKFKIDPIYFHAPYLINLADNKKIGSQSKNFLIKELKLAFQLKIKGSIIHLGSFKNQNNKNIKLPFWRDSHQNSITEKSYIILIENIKEILKATPNNSFFIIENAGNKKIGQKLEEIAKIIKDVNNPRVRLCLDTCHLFAAGYRFGSYKELDLFLEKLNQLDLFDKLELWHLNDSRDPFNSGRDRHQNIGEGTIGIKAFKILLNHPKTKHFPFIIETPGFNQQGPDKKNLDILKSLIKV